MAIHNDGAVNGLPDGNMLYRIEYSAQVEHPGPLKLNSGVAENEHLRRPG